VNMKGNLVTLAGLTNNTTGSVILTGQFSLQGVTTITVPQGMKLKISGSPQAETL